MSKIAFSPNDSGTGTFTIESPPSNSNRSLSFPDENGTLATVENLPELAHSWVISGMGAEWVSSTQVQIYEGQALSDVEFFLIKLTSPVTVDVTTTGAGGLADGDSIPTEGTLHFHAIADSSGSNPVSVVASTTVDPAQTNGALVSGYDRSRRVFSVRTDDNQGIIQENIYAGRDHVLVSREVQATFSAGNAPTSKQSFGLSIPDGVPVRAFLHLDISRNETRAIALWGEGEDDFAPATSGSSSSPEDFAHRDLLLNAGNAGRAQKEKAIFTTTAQAFIRSSSSDVGIMVTLLSWHDYRERRVG